VRDALSILDQAIAHGAGKVAAEAVQGMLGLADRTRVVDLFEHVMKGDTAAALNEIEAQHQTGADPATVLADLADFVHYVTRLKLAPNAALHGTISETERVRGLAFAEALSLRELSRAWQMLAKGIQEVALVARPLAAAEMVLVRLCHAADLPTPDEAIRMLSEPQSGAPSRPPERVRSATSAPPSRRPSAQAAPRIEAQAFEASAPEPTLKSFDDVILRAHAARDRLLVFALERHVRPVRFEHGRIEIALTAEAGRDLPQKLMAALKEWTGERWMVTVSAAEAGETVHEARTKSRASVLEEVSADPIVRQVLEKFPGAEIVAVRERAATPDEPVEAFDAPIEDEDF